MTRRILCTGTGNVENYESAGIRLSSPQGVAVGIDMYQYIADTGKHKSGNLEMGHLQQMFMADVIP